MANNLIMQQFVGTQMGSLPTANPCFLGPGGFLRGCPVAHLARPTSTGQETTWRYQRDLVHVLVGRLRKKVVRWTGVGTRYGFPRRRCNYRIHVSHSTGRN